MKTVVDLEASLGVDYYLDDTSTLTVGYRAEDLLNVGLVNNNEVFGPSGTTSPSANKLVSGPFMKFSGSF